MGAIISDQYLGKYNTIFYFAWVYLCGVLILFLTSLPTAIEHGAALGGVIVAMIVIGLGTGGIKSNVSPLIAEQYRNTKQKVRVLKSGEKVIIDPGATIQRIYMVSRPMRCLVKKFNLVFRSSICVLMLAHYPQLQPRRWRNGLTFGALSSSVYVCLSLASLF